MESIEIVKSETQAGVKKPERAVVLAICVLLAGGILAVYWPVFRYPFINFDDLGYILLNPHIRTGLSWETIKWAFTTNYAVNWHPLTWLSHALDFQWFGLNAGGHHLINVLLHGVNTVLVFLVLKSLTGATWRSAVVAGLFGFHPAHVESVAWVAERKDVLSALFFLLTIWSYTSYARTQAGSGTKRLRYFITLTLFILALLSKSMVVTLPFVLLLLDYWPLRRFQTELETSGPSEAQNGTSSPPLFHPALVRSLLLEKVPFIILSAIACVLTVLAQRQGGAVIELANIPFELRVSNSLVSWVAYLWKMCWPTRLAIYYPYPADIPLEEALGAAVLLLGISVMAGFYLRRRPYFAVGWFWYLGMLVPVIGLVQVGLQAMADRYTYLPSIGFFVAATWLVSDLLRGWTYGRWILTACAAAALGVCVLLTIPQVRRWKDSETLCRYALSVTADNAIVHGNLGAALVEQRRFAEGEDEFEEALRLMPFNRETEVNIGYALAAQGKFDDAISHYHRAIELRPANDRAHYVLSQALLAQGKRKEAISELRTTLQLNPDYFLALNDLAWMLATDPDPEMRSGAEAVELAEHACRLMGNQDPLFVGTLAAAYAEAGRFSDAVEAAKRAESRAAALGRDDLVKRNAQLLELYRAGQPYRETVGVATTPNPQR